MYCYPGGTMYNNPLNPNFDNSVTGYIHSMNFFSDLGLYISELTNSGGRVELFVGVFLTTMTGFSLDSRLLKDLSDLGVEVGFDLYGPEGH